MNVPISLPPDMENAVRQQAALSGQDITAFVLQAVQEKVEKLQISEGTCALTVRAAAANSVAAASDSDIEKKFLALAAVWRYDIGPTSSVTQMVAHPAYLQIIGLGRTVLPYLFGELARQPDHWFHALAAITGEDPVPPQAEGNVVAMTEAWLAWGRAHGYL